MTTKPHFQHLDSLRFLAVLAVFLFHFYHLQLGAINLPILKSVVSILSQSGYLGIDFFFTLSGFLISHIILSAEQFSITDFYLRRINRIVPLYLVVVIVCYVLLPLILPVQLPPLGYVGSFTANLYYAAYGDKSLFAITLLWSIAVEMQFYLVWGCVMKYLKRYLYLVATLLIVLSFAAKYYLIGQTGIYYHTITYIPCFALGSMGAQLYRGGELKIPKPLVILTYILTIAILTFNHYLCQYFTWTLCNNAVMAVISVVIILSQLDENSLLHFRANGLINYLGKISYGLYCYQGFTLIIFSKFLLPYCHSSHELVRFILLPIIVFAATTAVAAASYEGLESKFLRK